MCPVSTVLSMLQFFAVLICAVPTQLQVTFPMIYQKPPKPTDRELQTFDPGDLYLTAIDPIWDNLDLGSDPQKLDVQVDSLPSDPALLFAAHIANAEICNGGLHQFFRNPSGAIAPEAARGFRMLDLEAIAEILSKAIALFGGSFPREWANRRQQLRSLEGEGQDRGDWDPFADMDHDYFKSMEADAFSRRADAFVRSHSTSFFE